MTSDSYFAFMPSRVDVPHGAGMCQIGACEMARDGKSAAEILEYYFPGARVQKLYQCTSMRRPRPLDHPDLGTLIGTTRPPRCPFAIELVIIAIESRHLSEE